MAFKMKQKTSDDIRLYHTDHLGSTALVTDLDGEVTQHVAYIPYGEIFVEQRNGSWASPYLFNAKELDEETGLYYYGARYLDPTNAAWLSVDPLFEKYVGMTPYGYCAGNPVKLVDVDGRGPNPFDFFDGYSFDCFGMLKSELQGLWIGFQSWYENQVHGNSTVKTSLLLTAEFMLSYGPETRHFQNENFSEALKNSNMTTIALKAFQSEYERYNKGERSDIPSKYRVDFSILYPLDGDTGPFNEMWVDGPSIAQFTGTATYTFEISGENLNISVYDDKTEYSLLYHIPGTDRHERSERKFLGKTNQVYSFTIPLEEVKLRVQQDENK